MIQATPAFRVLVTGGRNYAESGRVAAALDKLESIYGPLVVIQGGATGADAFAREWCEPRPHCKLIDEPAKWNDIATPPVVRRRRRDGTFYNAAAGGIRNQLMLDQHKPVVVLAFKGGSGTADMVKRAVAAGVPVIFPR